MDDSLIFAMNEMIFGLLAEPSFWLKPDSYLAMAKVLLGLGAVIFVHELGHFLVAKACGVKCEKFYVGFDAFDIRIGDRVIVPRSLIKFQMGETEYGIGILPLGGYVKMLGQVDNPGDIEKEVERSINEGESTESAYTATGLVDRSKVDPRSFIAKSVPQRMAIISAGVIFNLIFAVLFAAWAFKTGVNYEPPIVGNVIGGGPAWTVDMTGAKLLRIGGKKVENYFTYMDMAQEVIFNGDSTPLEIEYIPYGETESKTVNITPQKGFVRAAKDLPLIGVQRRMIPKIGKLGTLEGNTASLADPAIEPGDVVVEVNGTPIETDIDLRQVLARDSNKIAEFVLERKKKGKDKTATELVRTKVAPNPMRQLGFSVQWLAITAIKNGSPAADAGLQIGDEIVAVNGQPRGDLLTLDRRMIQVARAGESTSLDVKRDGKTDTYSIQPVLPKLISDVGPNQPIAIDSLGVAIALNQKIESIEPGSPADNSNIEVGDEIVSVEYLLTDAQREQDRYTTLKKRPKIDLKDDDTNWAEMSVLLQQMETNTELEFVLKRGNQNIVTKIKTEASDEFYLQTRGIELTFMQKNYKSETWSDAMFYGYHQVINDVKRVGMTLAKLLKGQISPKNLGGPGTIALAATSEASEGTSRLLLFLTFLSANLAIVNFLPIPILDGGHMLFLAYEGIFRRPVSEKVQVVLTYAGLMMILGLMLFVMFLDIGRISSLL